MTEPLSNTQFSHLIGCYGAHPDRWPASQRLLALHCLVSSSDARDAWRDAADLDDALDTLPTATVSPALAAHLQALGTTVARPAVRRPGALVRQMLPYAAAAAIALTVGLATPSPWRTADSGAPLASTTAPAADVVIDNLTNLVLVDTRALADEEASATDQSDGDYQLSDLPLL